MFDKKWCLSSETMTFDVVHVYIFCDLQTSTNVPLIPVKMVVHALMTSTATTAHACRDILTETVQPVSFTNIMPLIKRVAWRCLPGVVACFDLVPLI